MIGTRLAHFEIKSHLGSGGMGDVYEAADSKLGRSVAIKFLPDAFALDADRVERFEREARVLASLNHSRIAGIYGLEESTGKKFLVMELVPGETLAERIARGAMPLDEALAIAKQIVEALEAAHEKGIVHRDLKPANVKITPDGNVKVLDFGLAKALDADGADANVSNSPTRMHTGGSMPGMILGTAPYMSPEQARGRVVDRRTDIFAFGCVLYEMLTGARAFDGEDAADILSAVMRVEPDWSRLPADIPSSIRTLLRLCLEKNVKNRRSDSTDLRLDLELALKEQPAPTVALPQAQATGPRRYLWPAAALLLGAISVFLAQRSFFAPAPDERVVQFDIAPPEGTRFNIGSQYELLSPDGRKIAFVANVEAKDVIWVRPLDSPIAIRLAGTEGASALFWSGDSQNIGFLANNQIKRTPATGGPVQVVTKDEHREAAWNAQGVILLGGDRNKPILQVPAAGGEAKPVMELDASRKEVSHDYPSFLPDGRHFLYMAREPNNFDLYVGDLQSKERRLLPNIKSGAVYSPTGHIIFGRGGTLMAQPFDPKRLELTGDAFPIGERYGNGGGPRPFFSASTNGAVAYVLGGNRKLTELGWFDRTGKALATPGPMAEYVDAALSPDARFVAFERGNPADIWIMDLQKGLTSRFTTADKFDGFPGWSPDGKSIVFTSARSGLNQIYQRTVGVVGEDQLLQKSETPQGPWDWSRDGKYLAFNEHNDIFAMPLAGDGKPIAVTQSPFAEYAARISPDGAWVAYVSNENGSSVEDEVYIQSFPNPGPRQQVSTSGGYQPQWKADGSELYYVSPDRTLMAVSIKRTGKSIEAGAPVSLFQMRIPDLSLSPVRSYNVSADGRFLLNVNKEDSFTSPIRVMINWAATLKK